MYGSSDFSQKYSRDDIFRGTDFNSVFNEFGFGQSTGGGMGDIFSHMFGGQQGGMGIEESEFIVADLSEKAVMWEINPTRNILKKRL